MTETLRGRCVLVTGADGFIGSHLVERLVAEGAEVRALVHYNSWNSRGWLADTPAKVQSTIKLIPGDVRDVERINEAVSGCEYVFHLSSLIGIPYSYEAPRSYFETNVMGALNVLQACRKTSSLARLVQTSTSEVYGSAQSIPISEDHPLVGQSPYAASKIAADLMAQSFHLSYGLPLVIARPFNTFGPRQTARAVIPTITSQLLSGCTELELGALTPTRDFNFVTDTVAGLIALGTCPEAEGQVVNIGSGEEWSIEQTAKLIMDVCGREVPIVCKESRLRPLKSEVDRLLADNSRIKSLIDWRSSVSFRDGLARTAKWIERNLHLFKPDKYNL